MARPPSILVENWKVFYVYWDTPHIIYVEAIDHGRAGDRL